MPSPQIPSPTVLGKRRNGNECPKRSKKVKPIYIDLTDSPDYLSSPSFQEDRSANNPSMLITLAEKEKEVSSLKDEMSELRRENERLLQSEQELQDTLTGQPINIKWGGCNNCGKKFDTKDDVTSLFVLDQCGAPWCGGCIRAAKDGVGKGPLCAHHPEIGLQSWHRVYFSECITCENKCVDRLIDMACGHTVCRQCLRKWAAEKNQTTVYELVSHNKYSIDCALCRKTDKYSDLIERPSFKHIPDDRRRNVYGCTARQARRA